MKWKKADLKIFLWPLGAAAVCVLLYFITPRLVEVLGFLTGLLLPFIIGYVLSKAINPLADLLQKQLKIPRGISAVLVIVLVIGLIIGLVYWGASSLSGKVKLMFVDNPDFKEYFTAQYSQALNKISVLYDSMPKAVQDAISGISKSSGTATNILMDYTTRFVKAMPNVFVGIIVAILSLYFMVTDSDSVNRIIRKCFSAHAEKSMLVWSQIKHYVGGYIKAQLIIMSITATIMSIWFIVLDVKYSVLIALGIALLDALPIFGSGLILWPWSVMNFLNGDIRMGFFIILVYVSIALTRHLTEPKLVSSNVGMNPLLTLLSMYIGYRTLGMGGLIIGPLTMLLIVSLYKGKVFDTPIAITKQVFKKTKYTLNALKEYILSDYEE